MDSAPSFAGAPKLRVVFLDECRLTSLPLDFLPENNDCIERIIVNGNDFDEQALKQLRAFEGPCVAKGGWVRGLPKP